MGYPSLRCGRIPPELTSLSEEWACNTGGDSAQQNLLSGKFCPKFRDSIFTGVLSLGTEFFPLFKESSISSSHRQAKKNFRRFAPKFLLTLPNPEGTEFSPPFLNSGTEFFPRRIFPKVNFPGQNPPPPELNLYPATL